MQKISFQDVSVRRKPTLHSRAHALADDLSREMREPKRFAAYLGIALHYYESDLRALARRVREKEDLPSDARGKYFFAALRGLPRTASAKIVRDLMPTPAAKKKKKRSVKNKKSKVKKRNAKRKSDTAARNRKRTA
ncbi:MAG: hypothetical protein WAP52_00540 [Candidatus Sungiibacteriota bacterium]